MAQQLYTPFLSQAGAAIGQGIARRNDREREQERNKLIQSAYMGKPGAIEELYAVDPQAASNLESQKKQRELADIQIQGAEASNKERTLQLLRDNKQLVDDTMKEAAKLGSVEEAQIYIDQVVSRNQELFQGVDLGRLTPEGFQQIKNVYSKIGADSGIKSYQPITLVNKETGEKTLASPTVDPNTGEAKMTSFEIPAGFDISTETPEEKRAADILASGLKKIQETRGKTDEERNQINIDRAFEAADSIPVIQRSLDLLDMVETGGIDNVQYQAKRILGIESADESELSYNLGKTVLSQLKATFGSAFTAAEGERLAALEGNLGKSVEGNRRILEQANQIAKRAANRGIRSAMKVGDEDSAQEIKDAMNFRFKFKEDIEKQESAPQDTKNTEPAMNQASGQPAQISSDAEYDALPSGAEFIAPDGSRRRKP